MNSLLGCFLDKNPKYTKELWITKESWWQLVFLPLAAVEEHVKLRTKKLRLSVNKFPAATSLCVNFICQNFDQSWSRLSFVGGNRDRWHVKRKRGSKCLQVYLDFFFFKPGCLKSPVKFSTLQAIFQIIILLSFNFYCKNRSFSLQSVRPY